MKMIQHTGRFSQFLNDRIKIEEKKKRRKHINFRIQITKKPDINTFITFLNKDIKKRLDIDKKYYNDNNECHLKHLNFITMEVLLCKTLTLFRDNFDNNSQSKSNDENENIIDDILYIPEEEYKKDLTKINRSDIMEKYKLIHNKTEVDRISNELYEKYKGFGFINLNFLKRKIYEYI
jgi:hypothetical protein